MDYRNEYEIRVFGMKHSGNHAVINWLASLFGEPVYFFNNCGYNHDPYRTGRPRGERRGTALDGLFVDVPKLKHATEEEIEPFRSARKRCIIYSYENLFLPRLEVRPATLDVERTVGPSRRVFDVVILRDVLNWAASTFTHKDRERDERHAPPAYGWEAFVTGEHNRFCPAELDGKNYANRHLLLSNWKTHAYEFLGATNYLRDTKITVSYNRWLDREYRERLATLFGLENDERTVETVARATRTGSQFTDMEYDGRASEMAVLRRWENLKGSRYYWDLFDEEALRLSAMAFT